MPHRSTLRGRVWKLTDLWTQRTRPQILAKPQNGFAQAPTRLIAILFHKNPKTRTPLGFSGQLPTDSAEEALVLAIDFSLGDPPRLKKCLQYSARRRHHDDQTADRPRGGPGQRRKEECRRRGQ